MFARLICVLIGYACGCVLLSDLVSRALSGRSAFELGDGNPGMANVGRILGKKAALLSLAGDILKTVLAVVVSNLFFPSLKTAATAWAGFGATLGHIAPVWHGFRGGKGVTCISTTIILATPLLGVLSGLVAFLAIVLTGYLSIAAVIAIAFYTIAVLVAGLPELALVGALFTALSVYAHWSKLAGIKGGLTRRAGLSVRVRKLFKR